MPEDVFDKALSIIQKECERILEIRKLKAVSRREWWGVGTTLENPGKASLSIFADFRDRYVDVNFMSPTHLDEEGTFVKSPYFDSPHHRFALWEVLQAKGLKGRTPNGALNPSDLEKLESLVKGAVDDILESCLEILDGDLSITHSLARSQAKG